MRSTCQVVACVCTILIAVAPLCAQTHIATQQALDAAVAQHVSAADQDRETVKEFLARSDVRALAGTYGIDIRRAEGAVATMSDAEAASIAAQARQAEQPLAGGASTV